jgi:hypothetical protein
MTATKNDPTTLEELAIQYDQAWNDHDLDRIIELQTPDSKFILRGAAGSRTWEGREACRQCYDYLLRAWPDQHMVRTTLYVAEGIYVANHTYRGTLVMPWEMGGKVYQPTGRPVEFEMVDIMYCKDNRVHVKDGWIDGLQMALELAAAEA